MTVAKMLTGKDMPMSNHEFIYWSKYFKIKAEREDAAVKAAGKGKKTQGPATQEFKRTMGQQN